MLKTFAIGLVFAATLWASPVRADVVSDWFEAADVVVARAVRAGPQRSPAFVHVRSQTALAMFEAANAIDRRYESYLGMPAGARTAASEAAIAAAAHRVLVALAPSDRASFDAAYAFALARVPDGAAEDQGVAIGVRAGDLVLARGQRLSATVEPYRPPVAPGVWSATTAPVFDTWELTMKPWFMTRFDQFRPGPPPELTSERYARDLAEVQRLGAANNSARTPEQTSAVRLWQWMDMTPAFRQVASLPRRTLVQNARFYALMSMAADDAYIAVTDAKLHYSFWRPIFAIRNAGQDGNDATTADPNWSPELPTPIHPEYPCAHCIVAAAYAAVAAEESNARVPGGLVFSDPEMPGIVFVARSFDAYATQTSMSRIYAGAHYRFSNEAAEVMGRQIGAYAVANFMRPLRGRR